MSQYALFSAIIIYALFSSPTPDHIGWVEWVIGGLLIVSVGLKRPIKGLIGRGLPLYLIGHRFFLFYMLTVPLALGVFYGNETPDVIRDFIPIIFLILPLCFYAQPVRLLEVAMVFAGGLFALRYCASLIPEMAVIDLFTADTSLLYLANAPLVSFAAIMGFHWLTDTKNTSLAKRLVGGIIAITCFAAMAAMMQRAPIILTVLACVALLGLRTLHKPLQSMVIGAIIMVVLIPFMVLMTDIYTAIQAKTFIVGWNNRLEELAAALNQSSLLGLGWGSIWKSPEVADFWVRYTHNIVSYYWVKAGVIGGLLSIGFLVMWLWQNIRLMRINTALGTAIFVPLIIHTALYTGFKTLDFALLLTLLTGLLWIKQAPKNESSF